MKLLNKMAEITIDNAHFILGIDANASEAAIKKAFRKKALSCHPDKHPDDPKAVETFVQLCQAQTILLEAFAEPDSVEDDDIDQREDSPFVPREQPYKGEPSRSTTSNAQSKKSSKPKEYSTRENSKEWSNESESSFYGK